MSDFKDGFIKKRTKPFAKLMRPVGEIKEHSTVFGRMVSTIRRAFLVVCGKESLGDETLNYNQIATRWGITEENRPLVIRGHYVEFGLLMLIGILGLVSIYFGIFSDVAAIPAISRVVGGLFMIFIAIARSSILMWRLDVLKNQHWITYSDWLRGR